MVSKVGKVIQEEFLENLFDPKCAKKARVLVRVRVSVRGNFSSCEMTTFDEPDGVQGWESSSVQEEFLENILGQKCAKSGLFSKPRVSVRVRVRVSFSRGGAMANRLRRKTSDQAVLGFESGRGRCVVYFDKALYSHCPKEKPSH